MNGYKTDDRRRKWWAGAWTLAYAATLLLLMALVRFGIHEATPPPADEGILINFGDMAEAGGPQDPNMTDVVAPASQPASSQQAQDRPSDRGDVALPTRDERQRPNPQAQPVENPRQADPRALFPGRTVGSTSTSEGTGAGAGNQGNPAGSPEGAHDGTGTGTSGVSFNLAGRSTVGVLPKPAYNGRSEGRVIVEITVDAEGTVTNAVYRAQGSTTNEASLVGEALRAARRAKFTAAEANLQVGTITYVFKMN